MRLVISDSLSLTVHPVPAPFSTNALNNNKISEGGNNQNEMLFNLGNLCNKYFGTYKDYFFNQIILICYLVFNV